VEHVEGIKERLEDLPSVALHQPFLLDLGGGNQVMMVVHTITRELRGETTAVASDYGQFVREHTVVRGA
jgi:hypothetical protein